MQLIKSIIYSFLNNLWGIVIPIIFIVPSSIFKSRKIADRGAKIWSVFSLWMLKKLCRIDFRVINAHNILSEPCIYACKHQSMWETIVMHLLINRPVYAYKKELEKIPFYGWFLKFMSGISVDRKGGMKSLKAVVNQAKFYLNNKQSIVIFPQGTRVPLGATISQYPYQAGITALYNSCNVKVVPVALNSGLRWPKGQFLKTPGTISIKFLPAIEQGLTKEQFNKRLIEEIEFHSEELYKSEQSPNE